MPIHPVVELQSKIYFRGQEGAYWSNPISREVAIVYMIRIRGWFLKIRSSLRQ